MQFLITVVTVREALGKYIPSCKQSSDSEVRQLLRDTAKEYFPRSLFCDAMEEFFACTVAVPGIAGEVKTLGTLTTHDVESWNATPVSGFAILFCYSVLGGSARECQCYLAPTISCFSPLSG
jgi:hypothetical protein